MGDVLVPESRLARSSRRILVVEDQVLVRLPIADALREAGLTVIEAGSADEALAYLDAGGMIDAVFSDIQMPGQVDGLQLARHLRQAMPTIPVVLTSGRFEATDVHDIARFIQKPYSLAQVVKTFLLLLERQDPMTDDR